jgi:hypothetical protein
MALVALSACSSDEGGERAAVTAVSRLRYTKSHVEPNFESDTG